jgi:hypothetical protein
MVYLPGWQPVEFQDLKGGNNKERNLFVAISSLENG